MTIILEFQFGESFGKSIVIPCRGGVKVNCPIRARETTLGCSPPAGRETRPLRVLGVGVWWIENYFLILRFPKEVSF